MHKTHRTWLSRIAIACILVTLAATPAWSDDQRPVVDDSQFGKDQPAPSTRPRLFLVVGLFLDLNEIVAEGYEKLGPEEVNRYFADARTHTNDAGAEFTAQQVIAGLKSSWPTNPLDTYLNPAGRPIPAAKITADPATKPAAR